jgi:radical SAM superfamily enzyme YgiQ (UPF0313 family)
LIQPSWNGLGYRRKVKVNERAIHPLALGVVAALSADHQVQIINEALEDIPENNGHSDIVGISANTFNAPNAYRIADRFRAQGTPVVLGGPHTSFLPEECLQHADSIVIGDAEDTWPQVLQDIQEHKLQPRYVSSLQNGSLIPPPRRDLFKGSSPHIAYCQISRGCGNKCRFCYLRHLPQATARLRDVSSVVDELRALPQSVILFVDDNIFCNIEYCSQVFQAIKPLHKKWWIQAPADLHHHPSLVALMAESGCFSVSIGFQTASNMNNQQEQILQNHVEDYAQLVQLLHRHGILVDGTFIFGFDGDNPGVFERTADLITRLGLDTYTFYFLTPYPGTEYYDSFDREGRILHRDWSRYDWDHVVIRPKQMTEVELREGVKQLYRRLDRGYFIKNMLRQLGMYRRMNASWNLMSFLMSTGWNYYRSPFLPK